MPSLLTGNLSAVTINGESIPVGEARLMDDGLTVENNFASIWPDAPLSHYTFDVPMKGGGHIAFTLRAPGDDDIIYNAMVSVHGGVLQAAMEILRCSFPAEFIAQHGIDDYGRISNSRRVPFNAISELLNLNLAQAKELFSVPYKNISKLIVKNLPEFQNHDGPFQVSIEESDLIRLISLMTDSFGGYDTLSDLEERDWDEFTTKCFAIQMEMKRASKEILASVSRQEGKEQPKDTDHWIDLYAPIRNPGREEYNGMLFETFGEDLKRVEEVSRTEPGKVWTLIEGDDGAQYISSGFHRVNRMGYFLCEKSYSGEQCEFLEDGVEEDDDFIPTYLKGTVFTTKDGRRHLTESARCSTSDEVIFSGRFDSIPGASKHLFLIETCEVEPGDDPVDDAWVEAAYVELTDAQAKSFIQSNLYGCDFQNSPLEKLMTMRVNAEVCPDTDDFDYVEYNAIDDILKLSWGQFQQLVTDGRETSIIGEDQLPSNFKGERTVRYDRLMLADLVDAFNGKEAFVGRDPEYRLGNVTKDMFEQFVSNGSRVRACHVLMDDYNERVALSQNQSPRMRA